MKCIGRVSREKYICEVGHEEIEKFMNLYYNKKKELEIGEEIDLGTGYDWHSKIQDALIQIKKFFEVSGNVVDTLKAVLKLKV